MFRFTISASEWAELVTVGNIASTDNARPLLTGVLLEVTRAGDVVTVRAVATDGYALVIMERDGAAYSGESNTVEGINDGETVTALVSAKGLTAASKSACKDAGRGGGVRVTIDGDRATVAACYGGALEYPAEIIEGTYPAYRSLITPDSAYEDSPAARGDVGAIALSPHMLARFCKVAPWSVDKLAAMRFSINDASRPVKAVSGRTTALLMPVRVQ